MGILNNPGNIITQSIDNLFSGLGQSAPEYRGSDFKSFILEEVDVSDGLPLRVELTGNQMPFQPVELGGSQKLQQEYYPGNPEPSVQVLGGREKTIPIKGRFKSKKFSNVPPPGVGDLRLVPSAFMDSIERMRRRGNLLKMTLGEFERYGFIEEATFMVKTLADIDYALSFMVVSLTKPNNCKLTDPQIALPLAENDALIKAAAQLEAVRVAKPVDFPGSLYDSLNDLISGVATAVSAVTKFVDKTISVAEDAQKLVNRALGLIRNARSSISQFKRRIGALDAYANSRPGVAALGTWDEAKRTKQAKYVTEVMQATSRPAPYLTPAMLAESTSKVSTYAPTVKAQTRAAATTNSMSMEQILARMEAQFRAISKTVPLVRHKVITGQTLQQISMKYYKTSEHWQLIYKHNKLTSTVLDPRVVLEIPKL